MDYDFFKHYDVILQSVDNNPADITNKIRTIGILRKLNSSLHLLDAKHIVENTPYTLGEYVREDIAENAKKSLEEHGCVVKLKER